MFERITLKNEAVSIVSVDVLHRSEEIKEFF